MDIKAWWEKQRAAIFKHAGSQQTSQQKSQPASSAPAAAGFKPTGRTQSPDQIVGQQAPGGFRPATISAQSPPARPPDYGPMPQGWEALRDDQGKLLNPWGNVAEKPFTEDNYAPNVVARLTRPRESDPGSPYSQLASKGFNKDAYREYAQQTGPNIGNSMFITKDALQSNLMPYLDAYMPDMSMSGGGGGGGGGGRGGPFVYSGSPPSAPTLERSQPSSFNMQDPYPAPARGPEPAPFQTQGAPPEPYRRDDTKYRKLLGY